MHRLQEKFEVIPVCSGGFKQTGGGGLAGEQQHFAVGAKLSHLNCQFDSGEQRHHDVGNEEVGRFKPSGF